VRRLKVHYTNAAARDIEEIARYTERHWGEEQRDLYLALLESACERMIPENVKHARRVPQRPQLLRWRCERHVVYFHLVDDGLEIVRILHERQLPLNHL
jgi:toxin ParE1/3/4